MTFYVIFHTFLVPPCAPIDYDIVSVQLFVFILDFFVWGYLKSKVYFPKPQTLEELELRIQQEISNIPREMILRAVYSLRDRAHKYLQNEGGHFEGR